MTIIKTAFPAPKTAVSGTFSGTADFNGDGRVDLITSNYGASTTSVFLNSGNGNFGLPITVSGTFSGTADFNSDGKADLITRDYGVISTTSVFLNNGNGSFNSPITVSGTFGGTADFNGDDKADLITSDYDYGLSISSTSSVFLNSGNGSFISSPITVSGTFDSTADFNDDGKVDLITSDYGSTTSVFLNNGSENFNSPITVSGTFSDYAFDFGNVRDFNGDGKADLITSDYGISTTSVFLNSGNGSFNSPITVFGSTFCGFADFNDDGKVDLITENGGFMTTPDFTTNPDFTTSTTSVFLNNGSGNFTSITFSGYFGSATDFNADGKIDLIIDNDFMNLSTTPTISVFLNNGSGNFSSSLTFSGSSFCGFADFNGDGKADLITEKSDIKNMDPTPPTTSVFLNNGSGNFSFPITVSGSFRSTTDFNGDGKADLITIDEAKTEIYDGQTLTDKLLVTSPKPVISTKPTNGNDQITGTTKAEKLDGLAGNDLLSGLAGNDTLIGSSGLDTLIGGAGADVLTGGSGTDIFKLTNIADSGITSTTRDTITDFKHSEKDKIDLSAIDANDKLSGDQAFTFIGSAAFNKTNASAQLRFDATSKILYGSTDADTAPEFSIQLNGVSSLVAGDFVL
jgi:Ca2+-binding RTX toxin-like protein